MEELGFEEIPIESSAGESMAEDFCCPHYRLASIYTEIPRQVRWPAWIRILSKDPTEKYGYLSIYEETLELECCHPTGSTVLHKTWDPVKSARCRVVTFCGSLQTSSCITPEYIETRQESAYACHILWTNVCGVVNRGEVGDAVGAADCKYGCGPYKYYRR